MGGRSFEPGATAATPLQTLVCNGLRRTMALHRRYVAATIDGPALRRTYVMPSAAPRIVRGANFVRAGIGTSKNWMAVHARICRAHYNGIFRSTHDRTRLVAPRVRLAKVAQAEGANASGDRPAKHPKLAAERTICARSFVQAALRSLEAYRLSGCEIDCSSNLRGGPKVIWFLGHTDLLSRC